MNNNWLWLKNDGIFPAVMGGEAKNKISHGEVEVSHWKIKFPSECQHIDRNLLWLQAFWKGLMKLSCHKEGVVKALPEPAGTEQEPQSTHAC